MEIPLRLIQMFSVQGDTVLDPFLGTGTTSLAAISAGRSSVGYEVDPRVLANIEEDFVNSKDYLVGLQFQRLQEHLSFVQKRLAEGREIKHRSEHYRFPVMTSQERKLVLPIVTDISVIPERPEGEKQYLFEASHESALDSVLAE
jgi:hypothetical protein